MLLSIVPAPSDNTMISWNVFIMKTLTMLVPWRIVSSWSFQGDHLPILIIIGPRAMNSKSNPTVYCIGRYIHVLCICYSCSLWPPSKPSRTDADGGVWKHGTMYLSVHKCLPLITQTLLPPPTYTLHTHTHPQTHCTHGTVYPHIYSQISMIAASVFKDPDHDISWLKPYWWVKQSFSHMLGSSECRTYPPLLGHCSPHGLTTLLIACLILETSCVQMTLRDPLLTMWTLLLR